MPEGGTRGLRTSLHSSDTPASSMYLATFVSSPLAAASRRSVPRIDEYFRPTMSSARVGIFPERWGEELRELSNGELLRALFMRERAVAEPERAVAEPERAVAQPERAVAEPEPLGAEEVEAVASAVGALGAVAGAAGSDGACGAATRGSFLEEGRPDPSIS
jgi:hypothetical protein